MARFKVTVKMPKIMGSTVIEKGMEVEVVTMFSTNPVIKDNGKAVRDAFLRVYGVDLKAMGALNLSYLDVKQIN